ncbi:MAG TPA: iron-sulfur cluster repair di-iron protein [Prolixibacteraceae bacterium]|nr:iron-sulfur cluster repair di-iron protein [Prolixibacteraceae bacterium]
MNIQLNTPVGEVVRTNFKTAKIFEQYRIDFCCGGNQSLEEASKKAKVDAAKVIDEIKTVLSQHDPDAVWFERMPLDKLSDYIVDRHHSYVRETSPFLQAKLRKLCDVHGHNHPELFDVAELFDQTAGNLIMHMQKEELILFPFVKKLLRIQSESRKIAIDEASVLEPIHQMEAEHQAEGERFELIAKFTGNYTVPSDGCETYRVTYQTLQEFEQDLHRHIHLENNLLFKKAALLEQELKEK